MWSSYGHPGLLSRPRTAPSFICLGCQRPTPACALTSHQCSGAPRERDPRLERDVHGVVRPAPTAVTSVEVWPCKWCHYSCHRVCTSSLIINAASNWLLLSLDHPHISIGQASPLFFWPPNYGLFFQYNHGNFLFIPVFCQGTGS